MTMPHVTNCSHSGDGWCLECVKDIADEKHFLHERLSRVNSLLKQIVSRNGCNPEMIQRAEDTLKEQGLGTRRG